LHLYTTVHIQTRTRPFRFADTSFDAALTSGALLTPEAIVDLSLLQQSTRLDGWRRQRAGVLLRAARAD